MHHLTRRPLKTIGEGLREPYKVTGLENRVRRRFIEPFKASVMMKSKRSRDERNRYTKRMPQKQDGRRNNPNRPQGGKRRAVDKRPGGRLRGPSGGFGGR